MSTDGDALEASSMGADAMGPADNVALRLYVSHFLSTFNSRLFEFGAFLFLAAIYPQTLLPASIYATFRALSGAALSPGIGRFIDRSERLHVVRMSILGQRTAVAVSCCVFALLLFYETVPLHPSWSYAAFIMLCVLAGVEKLSAIMNTISVEREWVVIITCGHGDALRSMNSQMRRIDLFCKLMAPLLIACIDSVSTTLAVIVTGMMNVSSVCVEYHTIASVYRAMRQLSEPKPRDRANISKSAVSAQLKSGVQDLLKYVRHQAFLPSFSLAFLHLTVLSFGGQMTVFLLALGLDSSLVGALRGVSAMCELSATWMGPRFMELIGPVRSGIWFINWQIFCVGVACACLWLDIGQTIAIIGTVSAVIASRVGLWGFDLSVQMIVQEEVDADFRGSFSSIEFAFQNIFEMLAFASTSVFAKPAQFKWPATISALAVAAAGVLYATFVRARRGHLVHLSDCMGNHSKIPGAFRGASWHRVSQTEEVEAENLELHSMSLT